MSRNSRAMLSVVRQQACPYRKSDKRGQIPDTALRICTIPSVRRIRPTDRGHTTLSSHYLPGILLAYGELIAVAVQHRGPRGVDYPKMDIEPRADRERGKIAKEFCASGSPRVCDNILRH